MQSQITKLKQSVSQSYIMVIEWFNVDVIYGGQREKDESQAALVTNPNPSQTVFFLSFSSFDSFMLKFFGDVDTWMYLWVEQQWDQTTFRIHTHKRIQIVYYAEKSKNLI